MLGGAMIFAAIPFVAVQMVDGQVASDLLRGGQLERVTALVLGGALAQVIGALLKGIAYSHAVTGQGDGLLLVRFERLVGHSSFDIVLNIGTGAAFAYVAWLVSTTLR
jgi:hypothetical protein